MRPTNQQQKRHYDDVGAAFLDRKTDTENTARTIEVLAQISSELPSLDHGEVGLGIGGVGEFVNVADKLGKWDRLTTADNTQEHPVRDSNPCYQIENLAS